MKESVDAIKNEEELMVKGEFTHSKGIHFQTNRYEVAYNILTWKLLELISEDGMIDPLHVIEVMTQAAGELT